MVETAFEELRWAWYQEAEYGVGGLGSWIFLFKAFVFFVPSYITIFHHHLGEYTP